MEEIKPIRVELEGKEGEKTVIEFSGKLEEFGGIFKTLE
jgi:hypothetical protein